MRRIFTTLFLLGVLLFGGSRSAAAQGTAYEQLQAFSGVLSYVRQNYVDSVDFSSLVQASVRGMLQSLDPHSRYATRHDFELQAQWERGELGEPGLSLDQAGGRLTVLSLAPNGPATRAGIQTGDRLVRMNDTTLAGLDAETVELRLLGQKGSKVRLTFERGSLLVPDTFAVTLSRAKIEHRVVSAPRMVDGKTGYVGLDEFSPPAPKALFQAIRKLKDMGAKQVILDLRGNPGGDMAAMIAIASAFLPKQTELFHAQGRSSARLPPPVVTSENGDFAKLPLVLLIDAGTASAAEILAGSLQDHDRALIVGRRSFGKALVQSSLPLPNGDVVWLTTARIATPSGRIIQRRYRGGEAATYWEGAGTAGAPEDSSAVYRTDKGRPVRGGGGILPDIVRPAVPELPVWFTVAMDSGYAAFADTVALRLDQDSKANTAWTSDSVAWDTLLVKPFLARVGARLAQVSPTPQLRARIGRILARRVASQRWGPAAETDFLIQNDGDIRAAVQSLASSGEARTGQ
jgi:carboxyl-terminal processing protease